MDKRFFGGAEITGLRGISVVPQMNMLPPEPFQQTVIGPGVVGRRNAV